MIDKRDFIEYDLQVIKPPEKYTNRSRLLVRCNTCKKPVSISLEKYLMRRLLGAWSCKKCVLGILQSDPIYQNAFRQMHSDPNYRSRVHGPIVKAKISDSMKKMWNERRKK